jgi:hypothetical protein
MSRTIEELKEYISHNVDEVGVLELLDISAEDLVEAFHDRIEEGYDKLLKELELEEEECDRTQ